VQIVPLVDIRSCGLRQLVHDYPKRAKDLITASRKTLCMGSELISRAVLPLGDRVSRDWLIETNNPYLEEIDHYADHLKVAGVHALNICYEWGCTSGVYAKEDGPALTRVLDWPFPKLGENIVVARQNGRAGDFYNVTWPGVSGMFHGMAPGRFAASLNQAPMRRHRLTYIGDWIKNRRKVFEAAGLPPAHVLRKVFEEAKNYEDAKERLARTPVALPVIYILAGIRKGEGCVIERTENDCAIRAIENDRVCASNQFETRLNAIGNGWRPRPNNSVGRLHQARTLPLAAIDDQFSWFKPPIANSHTRLAMMACAVTGKLHVFGTQGQKPVTEERISLLTSAADQQNSPRVQNRGGPSCEKAAVSGGNSS
jgi:hypothetical protein